MVCNKCGKCCKFVDFTFLQTEIPNEMIEYYKYHNIEVIKKEGKITYRIWNTCINLENNLCKIFETRPNACRGKSSDGWKTVKPNGCTD